MDDVSPSRAPFIKLDRPAPMVAVETRDDGTQLVRHPDALDAYPHSPVEFLKDAAADWPDRTFLAKRVPTAEDPARPWRHLSYAEALAQAEAFAGWLASRGLGPDNHVMILSENSLEQAIATFGAMMAGVPLVPVSPAYSLISQDHQRLIYIDDLIRPDVIFAQEMTRFAPAIAAIRTQGATLLHVSDPVDGIGSLTFADVLAAGDRARGRQAYEAVTAETTAKILFTSGTTGLPKGVINTHRNLAAAQAQIFAVAEQRAAEDPRILLDWLPWHHTFGGNAIVNGVARGADTLYIDEGRPVPGRFEETLKNLREIQPTMMSTVPATYHLLIDTLERDHELATRLFSRLRGLSYGGAALPQEICDRYYRLAGELTGERVPFGCGWGMTETTATGFQVYWPSETVGMLGLPAPGSLVKLVPVGDKLELRIKGPQVMPSYYKNPARTEAAFDEEGFFITGDAVAWVDPADPVKGLAFRGRVTEDFKLLTGTFVHAGALRLQILSELQPFVKEGLICGQDRDYVTMLGWPNEAICREMCPDLPADAPLAEIVAHDSVVAAVKAALHRHNRAHGASSERIQRFAFLTAPPDFDKGEITDKQSINQRTAIDNRATDVAALYQEPAPDRVIVA